MTAKKQEKAAGPLRGHLSAGPARLEYILFALLAGACFLLFNHPDILETARHSYILIRSTLDGNFLGFFEDTLQRTYGYPYVNAAHYNILMYLMYAVWILPLYLAEQLFGFAVGDALLAMWCKVIGTAFYLGSGFLVGLLAEKLGCRPAACRWAVLLFWLNPISFFDTLVMGQYDSICLFFTLWAVLLYLDRRYTGFSLLVGAGILFKFFPLFLFIPLLLLVEKRPLRLLKYGLVSLWLYLPTTLLFWGRTGDASGFTRLMADRLFKISFPGTMADASWFGLCMVLVCVAAYLYHPKSDKAWQDAAVYSGLAVFSLLFLFVLWHPQWLILLPPFLILNMLCRKEQYCYAYLNIALSIGFFILTAVVYPGALEGNLLDFGILQPLTGLSYALSGHPVVLASLYERIPYFVRLGAILFYGALLASLVFALPVGRRTLSDRLAGEDAVRMNCRLVCWGSFALGFVCCWLVPALAGWALTVTM